MSGGRKELERAVAGPLTCHVVKLTTPVFAVTAALLFAQSVPAAVFPTTKAITYSPANITPPAVSREFRAAWVATVANIDWPSKPGLPVEQQKSEMLAILDRAVRLNLNAIIFQVRPSCDAFYDSKIEPWSYYLTGTMGQAPKPYYDPLQFAVEEAHKRGLELHAWFNPYRAGHPSAKPPIAASHISRTRPALVRRYANKSETFLWLDPGMKEVQDYSVSVIMDVVRRYDIDGVHIDDYFYPYPLKDARNEEISFPDNAAWTGYVAGGGKLGRDDWRRENINAFVERLYGSVKAAKPWVKVGISPFGIWQPGYPPQIEGFNAWAKIYADSRKWLTNGWLDYCSPQLYWGIHQTNQSFPVLLKWWSEQNPKRRHLWPGLDADKVGDAMAGWKAEEIAGQIKIARNESAAGEVFWSMKTLMQDRSGIGALLANGVYASPALIPPSPWLEQIYPGKPALKIENGKAKWETVGEDERISHWVLQTRTGGQWETRILPGDARSQTLAGAPDAVSVMAIDRCGVASPSAVLQKDTRTTSGNGAEK